MLESFIVLLCLSGVSSVMYYSNPLYVGMGLLVILVFTGGAVSYYGGVYSFAMFMCVASGVLVVFAYSVSLTPMVMTVEELDSPKEESKGNKSFVKLTSVMSMAGYWLFLMVDVWWVFFTMNFVEVNSGDGGFSKVVLMSNSWSIGMILMGVLLFTVMVLCVGVAGKYQGALIE